MIERMSPGMPSRRRATVGGRAAVQGRRMKSAGPIGMTRPVRVARASRRSMRRSRWPARRRSCPRSRVDGARPCLLAPGQGDSPGRDVAAEKADAGAARIDAGPGPDAQRRPSSAASSGDSRSSSSSTRRDRRRRGECGRRSPRDRTRGRSPARPRAAPAARSARAGAPVPGASPAAPRARARGRPRATMWSTTRTRAGAVGGLRSQTPAPARPPPHLLDRHELHAVVGAARTARAAVTAARSAREIALDDECARA